MGKAYNPLTGKNEDDTLDNRMAIIYKIRMKLEDYGYTQRLKGYRGPKGKRFWRGS